MARRASRAPQGRPLVAALVTALVAVGACGGDGGPGGTLTVAVELPGADPAEVEQQVLAPLEDALAGAAGVVALRGRATLGLASVDVTFRRGVDAARARAVVTDVVAAVVPTLPEDAGIAAVAQRPAAWVLARTSDRPVDLAALSARATRLPSVVHVEACGVREARLALELVPPRMAAMGVTVADVDRAVAAMRLAVPAGRIDVGTTDQVLRVRGGAGSYDELADVVVAERDGAAVRVRDVAVITQRAEATCLVDGPSPGAKDAPALVRVGVRHPRDAAAVEQVLVKAGLTPLRGAFTVRRSGRPARVELVTAPVGPVIEALVLGDDALALAEQGGAAVVAAATAPGVAAAWCEGCALSTTQELDVDRQRAAELGVALSDIAQALRAATAGATVASYVDGDDEVRVVLGIEEGGTRWPDVLVRGANGGLVPLGNVVSVRDARTPVERLHVDRRRAVALRLRGAPGTSVAALRKLATSLLPAARVRTVDPSSVDGAPWL